MKCSELWLQEVIGHSAWHKIAENGYQDMLTLGGLEVESYAPVAPPLTGVVIGKVVSLEKHPEAKRLSVCQVDVGRDEILTIVCGAANVKEGIRVPVATVGTKLPGDVHITKAVLRGIESHGMICAADEIGLTEESDGILILADDAPIGMPISDYLLLDDHILELSITPNRGDCLSVLGIARELIALSNVSDVLQANFRKIKPTITDVLPVQVSDQAGCPRYIGRIIKNINPNAITPLEMKIRLERSGMRSINPVVDVTNYVMLELGQPMHGFDLAQIATGIVVRKAKPAETLRLLDESEVTLHEQTMVIADHEKPLAIAGVKGGIHSGISADTHDIFLESAYFNPIVVAKQRQYHGILSEGAHRFERGVDPKLQEQAIEYATSLIVEICGGEVGPLVEVVQPDWLPKSKSVVVTQDKINRHLGLMISQEEILSIFKRLNMQVSFNDGAFTVTPPSYRFDISIAEDLIEEVARVHGYHHIPVHLPKAHLTVPHAGNAAAEFIEQTRFALVKQGFHEVITYSFVDEAKQRLLNSAVEPRPLTNPIVANMNVMRTNLWPGLVETVLYNQSRQQQRTHFFEVGTVFTSSGEATHCAFVMGGLVHKEQWGCADRVVDFFDLKGHIENIISHLGAHHASFVKSEVSALHPGRQATVLIDEQVIGVFGQLHPQVAETLDIDHPIYLAEIYLDHICDLKTKNKQIDISKFPEVRRDIAILIDRTIPCAKIQDTIKSIAGDLLKEVFVFDVYEGDNIPSHLKSIAFAIILQAMERTLVDEEVIALMDNITSQLKESYGAELRR